MREACPECGSTRRHKKGCSKPRFGAKAAKEEARLVEFQPAQMIPRVSLKQAHFCVLGKEEISIGEWHWSTTRGLVCRSCGNTGGTT